MTHPILSAHRRVPDRSRGFGLLQVLLLISVIAGLATMGYLQWRERSAVNSARQERQALAQADRAIVNFATVMRRLPCPDINRDGLEDCGSGDLKGWLPSLSLSLAGSDPGVDVGQLRYLVQRGGGAGDLTVLTDSWRPLAYDDEVGKTFIDAMRETTATSATGTYKANILTLADLCQRLDLGLKTPHATGMAEVRSSPVRSVAYALVHPGNDDADGNNSPFDGVNASADPAVEDPARRPLLSTYNDIVMERSYQSLLYSFHCKPLIDSINTVALAHDVVEQVDDLRAGNIESAKQSIAFAVLAAAVTAIETTATVLEGVSEAGNAAVAWALCAATLGLAVNACAAAPQHTAAIVLTGISIGLNGASIAANVVAASMAGNALALADSSVDASDLKCPAADYTQALAAASAELNLATNEYNAINTQLTQKQLELVNVARPARDLAVNTLFYWIRLGLDSSEIDGLVQPLLDAAAAWELAVFRAGVAADILLDAQTAVTQLSSQVSDYANMVNNRIALLNQVNAEIAALDLQIAPLSQEIASLDQQIKALDLQIAAEHDPAVKAALQATRASLQTTRDARQASREPLLTERLQKTARAVLLADPTALQTEKDRADAAYAAALSALTAANNAAGAAQTSVGNWRSSFEVAYGNLRNAGRYTLFQGGLPYPVRACTVTSPGVCPNGDLNTSSVIQAALDDLLGGSSSSPNPAGKYLRPFKLEREIKALQDQLAPADKRKTDAQALVTRLQNLATSVPPCEISGTGVTPMPPDMSMEILIQVDEKGGTR